jgi:hypothetical protein
MASSQASSVLKRWLSGSLNASYSAITIGQKSLGRRMLTSLTQRLKLQSHCDYLTDQKQGATLGRMRDDNLFVGKLGRECFELAWGK